MNNNAIAVLLENKIKILKYFLLFVLITITVTSLVLNVDQKFTLINNELKITDLTNQKNQFYSDVLKVNNEKKKIEAELESTKKDLAECSAALEKSETEVIILMDKLIEFEHLKIMSNYVYNGRWHYKYTQRDIDVLAATIYGENYISGRWEMMITGSVVLNRILSADFPDTVEDVVFQVFIDANGNRFEQYAERTKNLIGSSEIPEVCYKLAEILLKYGPVVPPFVLYQAHFNQGNVFWEWKGEQFCYK